MAQRPQGFGIMHTGKLGPVPEGSEPAKCVACEDPILPGQFFSTVPVGCGKDPENRKLCRLQLPFTVVVAMVHWACLTGDESESRLSIV